METHFPWMAEQFEFEWDWVYLYKESIFALHRYNRDLLEFRLCRSLQRIFRNEQTPISEADVPFEEQTSFEI